MGAGHGWREAREVATGYRVGDVVQDFSLKNVDGKKVSMADYEEAKGFVLVFTCNTCPYSQFYEDRINGLSKKYASSGFPVIAINPNDAERKPDDSYEKMVVRAKEKEFEFPYLHDESQEVAKMYGAARTPHVFVLSKEGALLKVAYIGAIDDNYKKPEKVKQKYVEAAVDSLLKGEPVEKKNTKAVGCGIKWRRS